MVFAVNVEWALAFVEASGASAAPKEGASLEMPTVRVQLVL
jgi:hypothetical protein